MRPALTRSAALLLGIAVMPAVASAQGIAKTLDELRLLTRVGETVTVTDTAGREAGGRITSLSADAIVLRVNGQPREWKEGDIATIRQRKSDSLGNGALWGLGIGAGLAAVAIASSDLESGDEGWVVLGMAVYGGIGAAIGVGVDALITRPHVIYEKPGTATARWRVAPIVSRTRQGARLMVRF